MAKTILFAAIALLFAGPALAQPYALRAAPLRAQAAARAAVVDRVDANQDLVVLSTSNDWAQVRLGVDVQGWLPADAVSDEWIEVWKHERKLHLMKGTQIQRTFRMALGARQPEGQKRVRGDGATPEGRYFIAEADPAPGADRYGARSLRISYPSAADARRGLGEGQIDRKTYLDVVRAVRAGQTPPQHTALGGSIRIHGGGSANDWTLGCMALDDGDVAWLYDRVKVGTRVDVHASAAEAQRRRSPAFTATTILSGAQAQLTTPALYTVAAMRAASVKFPAGDIDASQAVCTDIVVRALRAAGIDLQAMVFEDRSLHAERYRDGREGARPSVDHRRVRTLVPFLRRYAVAGSLTGAGELRPGDIVVFDTGIANGTPYDHIGIVDAQKDGQGHPQAINIWTVGYRTSSMSLIGKSYPQVAAWFRLGHSFAGW